MSKVIFLDMDGVLVDLTRHTYRKFLWHEPLVERAFNETLAYDGMHVPLTQYTQRTITEADVHKTWKLGGSKFWSEAPWTSFGERVYDMCLNNARTLIMSTPTRDPSCAKGKVQWIEDNLYAGEQRKYSLTPCKSDFAKPSAILIDDHEKNVDAFEAAGGQSFLWPAPWNRRREMDTETAMLFLRDTLTKFAHG